MALRVAVEPLLPPPPLMFLTNVTPEPPAIVEGDCLLGAVLGRGGVSTTTELVAVRMGVFRMTRTFC